VAENRTPEVGGVVTYYDPAGVASPALVTAVWTPECINLVFVSRDEERQDSYGRQIERQTSLTPLRNMGVHGGGWTYPDEEPPPRTQPQEV